ncbi:hypothetical protein D3C79_586770 [compost metagenome]
MLSVLVVILRWRLADTGPGAHASAAQALGRLAAGAVERGQAGGLEPWRDAGRLVVVELPRAIDLAQISGKVRRFHVAHVVHEQLRFVATAFIDGADPVTDFLQILRLRRDGDDRVGAFVGHEPDHVRQWHAAVGPEQLLQLRHELGHRGALQAVNANRHALEPVDVEGVDGVLVVGEFIWSACQADHVAGRVDQQEGILTYERLEQLLHFAGADVAQRVEPGGEARGRLGDRHLWHQFAGDGLVGRQDHIALALADHGVIGPRQQRFQNRQCLLLGDRLGGGETDAAFDTLADAVVFMQQVAHDAVDHRLDGLVGEVEHDIALLILRGGGRCRGLADETLVAGDDLPARRAAWGRCSGSGSGLEAGGRRGGGVGAAEGLLQQRRVGVQVTLRGGATGQGDGDTQAEQWRTQSREWVA